jgi:hypothetical protein
MSEIIAFCKNGCPYSNETKWLLTLLVSAGNSTKGNSTKIIPIESDYMNVKTINGKEYNKSKSDFFQSVAKDYDIELNNHKSFPVNIFKSGDHTYFIGGNDKLQDIYKRAQETPDIRISNPGNICIEIFKDLENEGHRRLYCHFLKILNKIN